MRWSAKAAVGDGDLGRNGHGRRTAARESEMRRRRKKYCRVAYDYELLFHFMLL
jgi:hypothetical protein